MKYDDCFLTLTLESVQYFSSPVKHKGGKPTGARFEPGSPDPRAAALPAASRPTPPGTAAPSPSWP